LAASHETGSLKIGKARGRGLLARSQPGAPFCSNKSAAISPQFSIRTCTELCYAFVQARSSVGGFKKMRTKDSAFS